MKTKLLLLTLLIFPWGNIHGKPLKKTCTKLVHQGLYLKAYSCNQDRLLDNQSDKEINRFLLRLNKKIEKKRKKTSMLYRDQNYLDGVVAWQEWDVLKARNHWHRFLESASLSNKKKVRKRVNEVRPYYELAEQVLLLKEPPRVEEIPLKKSKKRLSKKKKPLMIQIPIKKGKTIRELMGKARLAESLGQLDVAANLYAMALKMSPTSKEIRARFEKLKKEIN